MKKDDFRNEKESHVKELIQQLFRSYRMEDKLFELEILSKWEELMGKAVAVRTKNIYIKNKILHLTIDSSVMREELSYGKTVIIERINSFAGKEFINDVWFK
ncbi:MAG: DUF721 domain-containing protein [Flavobacteriia bacterium]|nr:DUF721 domain-containing protein [Flavobacteriia bacterium]